MKVWVLCSVLLNQWVLSVPHCGGLFMSWGFPPSTSAACLFPTSHFLPYTFLCSKVTKNCLGQIVSGNPEHKKDIRGRIVKGWSAFSKHSLAVNSDLPLSLKRELASLQVNESILLRERAKVHCTCIAVCEGLGSGLWCLLPSPRHHGLDSLWQPSGYKPK